MTENEAIIQLNFDMEMIRFNPDTGGNLTLEQIKAHNEDNYKTYLADEVAITALMEIQQYRAIGTIEEFKALKEKGVVPVGIVKFNKEDMQEIVDEKIKEVELDIQAIRNKAITEFAERLKTVLENLDKYHFGIISLYDSVNMIDEIAEEMRGAE